MEIISLIIIATGLVIGLFNFTPFAVIFFSLLEKIGFKLGDKYGLKATVPSPDPKFDKLINKTGFTKSSLSPSGIGLLDGRRIDVISSDKFIDPNTEIIVNRVEGNRIYVEEK